MPRYKKVTKRTRRQDAKVPRVVTIRCTTPHVWKFEKTDTGVKRICTVCGFSVTDVGRTIINTPLSVLAEMKKREYHPRRKVD